MLSSPIASMTWRSGFSSASVAMTHWRKKYWLGVCAIWISEPGPNFSHASSSRHRYQGSQPQVPSRNAQRRAGMPLEDAAGGHAAEGHHELDGVAAGLADDAAVRGVEVAARDVVAERRLPGRMEADRHAELLDGGPERLHLRVVNVPSVDRVRVADDRHRAEPAHRAPGLGDRAGHVVERDLGGELQARRLVLAVVVRPVVVRGGERGGDRRVEVVVHEHLAPARAVEHRHVDALDVHGLDVRRRVVAARVRDLVVRRPLEGAPLEILADGGGVRALGHLPDLEIADLDHRLIRRVGRPAPEPGRELLERLGEIALPEAVGLHRVQIRVHDLEVVLHRRASRCVSAGSALGRQHRGERLDQALELRVAHRRREAAEAGDGQQHPGLHEPADDPAEPLGLLGRGAGAAVVGQLPVGRVQAEERAHAGDRAGHARALEAGLEARAQLGPELVEPGERLGRQQLHRDEPGRHRDRVGVEGAAVRRRRLAPAWGRRPPSRRRGRPPRRPGSRRR